MTITPIDGKQRDLGDGFVVRRMLPHLKARHVGPFVFFDQMGPASFGEDKGMDVRPHPHIGLATVTWLFQGAIRHRDSLGSAVDIHPGDVNWMTAGRGIAHSERTPPDERHSGQDLHGIQVWVALPKTHERIDPEFHHHPASTLPVVERDGARLVVIAGEAFGVSSPVRVFAPMFFVEARLEAGARVTMPEQHAEWGAYVVEGAARFGDLPLGALDMAVAHEGEAPVLEATQPSLIMLFGGAPLDGERHLWWNFVASSKELIEAAKVEWAEGRFPLVPGDESERIPLPSY
ncbi:MULTISPECIES: pirin family protein [unclassified Luteibacter]|uniref:pirin family protein n=1 Tax=unclassified Luteibacter TaxID=2620188 RepID=UPI0005B7E24E|nr:MULTISPECIES: pirin family protein [unclassified Luteibacter]MDR6644078.1 redox-sensitive bicupin YhaK (pirin superfamily) [Luteibacter sp. 1214]